MFAVITEELSSEKVELEIEKMDKFLYYTALIDIVYADAKLVTDKIYIRKESSGKIFKMQSLNCKLNESNTLKMREEITKKRRNSCSKY